MLNMLFNTLLKITPHNTQKEEEETKEQRSIHRNEISSQKCPRFRFEYPFTSMIAGMTGSGKTAWVRSLFHQA